MTKSNLVKSVTKIALALTVLSIGVATSASANAAVTLLDDNFDTENGGVGTVNYNQFTNWNVTTGAVDIIGQTPGNPEFYDFLPGNGLYLDMDGSPNPDGSKNIAGTLESKTTFSFNPGDVVHLSFDLAGTQRPDTNTVIASLGSLWTESYTLGETEPFTTFTKNFTITSPTIGKLSFQGTGGDEWGLLLDNVKLSYTPVPEPLTIFGSLTAGAFGLALRRKYKPQQ